MKKRVAEGFSSPENSQNGLSPAKNNKKSSGKSPRKKRALSSSNNESPKIKKSKSKSSKSSNSSREASLTIDPKPSKEKRTKQTKLSFIKPTSSKTPKSGLPRDDDATYCEELENRLRFKSPQNVSFSRVNSSDVFNFENVEKSRQKKNSPKVEPEVTPEKISVLNIKQEHENSHDQPKKPNAFNPVLSPDLFMSDMSENNSVLFVEPLEKEIISVPDSTYNPALNIINKIGQDVKDSKMKRLFDDSLPCDVPNANHFFEMEERDMYNGECMDCQIVSDLLAHV